MNAGKAHKANKVADVIIKIITGVGVIIIGTVLLSGGKSFQSIKNNSDKVPEMEKKINYCYNKWDVHDSTAVVQYILDTTKEGQMFRAIIRTEKLVREIYHKNKLDYDR